jgi:hypothetical protein
MADGVQDKPEHGQQARDEALAGRRPGEAARIERRSHFRGRARGRRLEVRFRGAGATEAEPDRGETEDIGTGGAFVRCARPLAVGSRIDLEIHFSAEDSPLLVFGVVRWVSAVEGHRGMGLRFGPLDADALLALSEYFATLPVRDDIGR